MRLRFWKSELQGLTMKLYYSHVNTHECTPTPVHLWSKEFTESLKCLCGTTEVNTQ